MAFILSPEAQSDLNTIWDYLAEESGNKKIADNQIESITKRFYLIATYPKIGRIREDLGNGIRNYVGDNYIIVYYIAADDVFILRIVHHRRDLVTLMRDKHN